jgi:hypothetical protein
MSDSRVSDAVAAWRDATPGWWGYSEHVRMAKECRKNGRHTAAFSHLRRGLEKTEPWFAGGTSDYAAPACQEIAVESLALAFSLLDSRRVAIPLDCAGEPIMFRAPRQWQWAEEFNRRFAKNVERNRVELAKLLKPSQPTAKIEFGESITPVYDDKASPSPAADIRRSGMGKPVEITDEEADLLADFRKATEEQRCAARDALKTAARETTDRAPDQQRPDAGAKPQTAVSIKAAAAAETTKPAARPMAPAPAPAPASPPAVSITPQEVTDLDSARRLARLRLLYQRKLAAIELPPGGRFTTKKQADLANQLSVTYTRLHKLEVELGETPTEKDDRVTKGATLRTAYRAHPEPDAAPSRPRRGPQESSPTTPAVSA